ncbi:hypothetical protein HanXRQr2_Chr11g0484261 [Helianthus annuus]|uniref:Uncharacterized protein n=1 Tax=Helianthus annuus TaxID=4232 RepID=A0A9K3MZK8_HELAN|nr:hypothetical protein HanXRQr2_Chr11g0484261 [Helianthus annuus]
MRYMIIRDHPRTRRRYCNRGREQGKAPLMQGYFFDNLMYDRVTFRRNLECRNQYSMYSGRCYNH